MTKLEILIFQFLPGLLRKGLQNPSNVDVPGVELQGVFSCLLLSRPQYRPHWGLVMPCVIVTSPAHISPH